MKVDPSRLAVNETGVVAETAFDGNEELQPVVFAPIVTVPGLGSEDGAEEVTCTSIGVCDAAFSVYCAGTRFPPTNELPETEKLVSWKGMTTTLLTLVVLRYDAV